ncbi:hypothetical protein [Streptomyces sp. NPDC091268]|uniref:hypothetical protein n=1 Tax=Streptomyces sp. NPDC091268 TaxID=3365979 RepID=UPI003800A3D3
MLKPTRTILALTAGSLVLGLGGAGAAVADEEPMPAMAGHQKVIPTDEFDNGYPDGQDGEARGIVISHGKLAIRSRATTRSFKVGSLHPHEKIAIECKKRGERVDGNDIWYLLEERGEFDDPIAKNAKLNKKRAYDGERWVSARYVKNLTRVQWCY